MRVAYLDEAGISKAEEEPYFVVAGVILAPDGQWREVEAWMRALAHKYLGEDVFPPYGRHFCFHAKDIWHGSGVFRRTEWPLAKRLEIFEAISSVPRTFKLPIVYGYFNRARFNKEAEAEIRRPDASSIAAHMHAAAVTRVAKSIDRWMSENTNNEVVMMIAEDVNSINKMTIDAYHALYVDRASRREPTAFQAKHIVEQVSFMRKDQSGILQLADMCAFVLKRKLQGCPKIQPFFDRLAECLYHRARSEKYLQAIVPIADIDSIG